MSDTRRMNNRGSAFIIVIVIISFVGVLATIVLSMSSMKAQINRVDSTSKDTFYDVETALNEVTLGIENVLASASNSAYNTVFTNFTGVDDAERNANFQNAIKTKIEEDLKFNETVAGASGLLPVADVLQGFITNTKAKITDVAGCSVFSDYLKIRSLKIEYSNGDYSNTITTDIRINLPSADLSANIPQTSTLSFEKFGVICENELVIDNKKLLVNGDVYAGPSGIYIHGAASQVAMVSENIISKGDIGVYNTASTSNGYVNFNVARKSANQPVNMWCKNIKVYDNPTYGLTTYTHEYLIANKKNTDVEIQGANVKVADDLELSTPASRVILAGQYFGFGSSDTVEENSSSITINGRGSYLDIKALSSLQLAGRAFLTAPNGITGSTNEFADIAMAGSLDLKGSQIAYLVPSACISVKHNPVTNSEFISGVTVDIAAADQAGFHLADYLDATTPYRYVAYRKPAGGTVMYYYLNVRSEMLTDFFKAYCATFGTTRMADIFDLSGLKTNTYTNPDGSVSTGGTIAAPGTIVSEYSKNGLVGSETVFDPGSGAAVKATAVQLGETYKYWTSFLKSNRDEGMVAAGYTESKGVVENLINKDLIDEIHAANPDSDVIMDKTDAGGSGYRVLIVDNYGKAAINVPVGMKGVLIATGDVNVNFESGTYTGLIVAGCKEMRDATVKSNGHVYVNSTSNIVADSKIVKNVLGNVAVFNLTYVDEDDEEVTVSLGDFFNEPAAKAVIISSTEDSEEEEEEEEEESRQSLAGLVVYENWTKE